MRVRAPDSDIEAALDLTDWRRAATDLFSAQPGRARSRAHPVSVGTCSLVEDRSAPPITRPITRVVTPLGRRTACYRVRVGVHEAPCRSQEPISGRSNTNNQTDPEMGF